MALPINPPYPPMEALSVDKIPTGESWRYEPKRKALLTKLEPRIKAPGFTGNARGGPSRWSTERSGEWQPLKPDLVVEVQYIISRDNDSDTHQVTTLAARQRSESLLDGSGQA